MPIIANGKEIAEKIYSEIKSEIVKNGYKPRLSIILTNDNESGKIYVRNKIKAAEKTGIQTDLTIFPANVSETELLNKIRELNNDVTTDAILVQLPLPAQIDPEKISDAILPEKDADGFHFSNAGKLFEGRKPLVAPCTPSGILYLLDEYKIDLAGANAVVIGRSNIVGKPVAQMLLQRNATVSILHSKTKNLQIFTKNADLIVCATGHAGLLTGNDVKEGVVVIDVGISRVDGKLKGDVDFDSVYPKSKLITPVPGGVGPLTIAMLAKNTLELHKNKLRNVKQ